MLRQKYTINENLDYLKTVYLQKAIEHIPKILSHEDRDPYSPSYGCFDRQYWGWKLKDFPDANNQYALFSLAFVYAKNFGENPYYRNKNLKEWIIAGINFWASIQHRNGSFDMCYPYEQAVGTTHYTMLAISNVLSLMKEDLPENTINTIMHTLEKGAQFACKHDETYAVISNHLANYAASLFDLYTRFNKKDYLNKANEHLSIILKNQSKEGWFLEYEGPDPGYQTQTIYYMALIYRMTEDKEVFNALKNAIDHFSIYFVHPDGTIGGGYGCRNTEIIYPVGFEMLKDEIPNAGLIAKAIRSSIEKEQTVTLKSMDFANLIRLMANYFEAYFDTTKEVETPDVLPYQKETEKYFPESKIFIKSTERYYAIFSGAKGGVLKVFDKEKGIIAYDDAGYIGMLDNGALITSQIYNQDAICNFKDDTINTSSQFFKYLNQNLTPWKMFFLRGLNLTILRSIFIGDITKKIIVKMLFTTKKSYPVSIIRNVKFEEDKIFIEDTLETKGNIKFKFLESERNFFCIHMASSKYFQKQQLVEIEKNPDLSQEINKTNKVKIKKVLEFGGENDKFN